MCLSADQHHPREGGIRGGMQVATRQSVRAPVPCPRASSHSRVRSANALFPAPRPRTEAALPAIDCVCVHLCICAFVRACMYMHAYMHCAYLGAQRRLELLY